MLPRAVGLAQDEGVSHYYLLRLLEQTLAQVPEARLSASTFAHNDVFKKVSWRRIKDEMGGDSRAC